MNHTHRAAWGLALWPALALALGNAGCAEDECHHQARCNGDVLERCVSGSYGSYETYHSCGPGLCQGGEGDVFCALDKQPDQRCGSRSYVCDGAVLVSCYEGYATATYNCAVGESLQGSYVLTPGTSGACVDVAGSANCVAEAEPDPNCRHGPSSGFSQCSGNDRIACVGDYVTQRTPCAPALCRQGQLAAVCALPEEPDVDCKADQPASSFCVGERLVIQCAGAYRVSEKQCLADEHCGFYPSVGYTCLTVR